MTTNRPAVRHNKAAIRDCHYRQRSNSGTSFHRTAYSPGRDLGECEVRCTCPDSESPRSGTSVWIQWSRPLSVGETSKLSRIFEKFRICRLPLVECPSPAADTRPHREQFVSGEQPTQPCWTESWKVGQLAEALCRYSGWTRWSCDGQWFRGQFWFVARQTPETCSNRRRWLPRVPEGASMSCRTRIALWLVRIPGGLLPLHSNLTWEFWWRQLMGNYPILIRFRPPVRDREEFLWSPVQTLRLGILRRQLSISSRRVADWIVTNTIATYVGNGMINCQMIGEG